MPFGYATKLNLEHFREWPHNEKSALAWKCTIYPPSARFQSNSDQKLHFEPRINPSILANLLQFAGFKTHWNYDDSNSFVHEQATLSSRSSCCNLRFIIWAAAIQNWSLFHVSLSALATSSLHAISIPRSSPIRRNPLSSNSASPFWGQAARKKTTPMPNWPVWLCTIQFACKSRLSSPMEHLWRRRPRRRHSIMWMENMRLKLWKLHHNASFICFPADIEPEPIGMALKSLIGKQQVFFSQACWPLLVSSCCCCCLHSKLLLSLV